MDDNDGEWSVSHTCSDTWCDETPKHLVVAVKWDVTWAIGCYSSVVTCDVEFCSVWPSACPPAVSWAASGMQSSAGVTPLWARLPLWISGNWKPDISTFSSGERECESWPVSDCKMTLCWWDGGRTPDYIHKNRSLQCTMDALYHALHHALHHALYESSCAYWFSR